MVTKKITNLLFEVCGTSRGRGLQSYFWNRNQGRKIALSTWSQQLGDSVENSDECGLFSDSPRQQVNKTSFYQHKIIEKSDNFRIEIGKNIARFFGLDQTLLCIIFKIATRTNIFCIKFVGGLQLHESLTIFSH